MGWFGDFSAETKGNGFMLKASEIRDFGKMGEAPLPQPKDREEESPLTRIQTDSYKRFLQAEVSPDKRENHGLQALLKEVFPIESYDGNMSLEYVSYELGK